MVYLLGVHTIWLCSSRTFHSCSILVISKQIAALFHVVNLLLLLVLIYSSSKYRRHRIHLSTFLLISRQIFIVQWSRNHSWIENLAHYQFDIWTMCCFQRNRVPSDIRVRAKHFNYGDKWTLSPRNMVIFFHFWRTTKSENWTSSYHVRCTLSYCIAVSFC